MIFGMIKMMVIMVVLSVLVGGFLVFFGDDVYDWAYDRYIEQENTADEPVRDLR